MWQAFIFNEQPSPISGQKPMRLTSVFQMVCSCGRTNYIETDRSAFECGCGIKSVVDFRSQLSTGELTKLLDGVMKQADGLSKIVEIRRDRMAS
jgi:hypothetical protein